MPSGSKLIILIGHPRHLSLHMSRDPCVTSQALQSSTRTLAPISLSLVINCATHVACLTSGREMKLVYFAGFASFLTWYGVW